MPSPVSRISTRIIVESLPLFFFFFAFFDRLKNHFFSTATQISQV